MTYSRIQELAYPADLDISNLPTCKVVRKSKVATEAEIRELALMLIRIYTLPQPVPR